MSRDSARLRARLVHELEAGGAITDPRVRDAFLSVPRELFVPEVAARDGIEAVYRDEAIATARNARGVPVSSSSQPTIMGAMLERLGLEDGMRVLEVGTGTGYNAALLSLLVGERGRVVSIDVERELVCLARGRLRAGGYRVRAVVGDGRDGFPERAPYDRIVVTASSDSLPVSWFEQLVPGGLVEVPLQLSATGAQGVVTLRRTSRGLDSTRVLCCGFMPLRGAGERDARSLDRPALHAVDRTGEESSALRHLAGDALRTLSQAARRRLLSIALGESRRYPLGLRAPAGPLMLYLSMRVPSRRLVATAPGFGLGRDQPRRAEHGRGRAVRRVSRGESCCGTWARVGAAWSPAGGRAADHRPH